MGHQRLGDIPKTRKWKTVVEKITGTGGSAQSGGSSGNPVIPSVASIASEILAAAEGGLAEAKNDPGFRYTVYLLTQIVLAARKDDWQIEIAAHGIKLDPDATVFDLTSEVHRVIEEYRRTHPGAATIGDMAQQAAGEALSHLAKDNAVTLFGDGRDELQLAIKKLSTKAGFCDLGQRFFGNFTARFLDFYASKILPKRAGQPPFNDAGDFNDFKRSLFDHCHESAKIVHDFCGQWYSKKEFEEGIYLNNTGRFVAHAIDKLRDELKKQQEGVT